jgi:hypothetical protein
MGSVDVVPLFLWAWEYSDHSIPPASVCRSTQYGQPLHRMCPRPVVLHAHSQMLHVPQVPLIGPRMYDRLVTPLQQLLPRNLEQKWCPAGWHHVYP